MKKIPVFLLFILIISCTQKGPQTFDSPFIGKTKKDLIAAKGVPPEIKVFDNSEAYVYKTREEYFGKKVVANSDKKVAPKRVYIIESIYYINDKGSIYKYQVWKKRVD